MADDGLNGRTPFELALDLRRDAALLAARVDLELVIGWGVVAAIAGVGDAAMEDVADERLHLRNDRAERVPVIGIAGQCCGMGDELPAGGMFHRGGDAHLDPELVRPVRFALADARLVLSKRERIALEPYDKVPTLMAAGNASTRESARMEFSGTTRSETQTAWLA